MTDHSDTLTPPIAERFAQAETLEAFMARAEANRELWLMTARRAALPDDVAAAAAQTPGRWHLLVLVEDWCGDAVNTVPVVQRLAEAMPGAELRVLERDRNLDLMDTHLTNGARSIPLVIVYDDAFREVGQWGPRPRDLQTWVMTEGRALEKDERYKRVRTGYARDRGATTAREVLAVIRAQASG